MRDCWILMVAIFAYFNFYACDSSSRNAPQTAVVQHGVIELRPIPAVINEKRDRKFEVVESAVGPSGVIDKAQFVDANNGWAGNRKVLYRTSDAGKSWQRSTLQLVAETVISSFFFINRTHGWLTTTTQVQAEKYGLGNSSAILVTDDGGNTWRQQSSYADEVMLNNVAFIDTNRGMAVGGKIRERNLALIDLFLVSTSDGGKTWSDVSERIKPAIGSGGGDYRVETYWISSSKIYLLTEGGRVFATDNGGETWSLIASFKDIRPGGVVSSTGYHKLLFTPQGQLGVLAGASGEEGFWGDLIVPGAKNSWTSYELIRVPLFDALFLSENEVLACGGELYPPDEKSNAQRSPKGIILYSNDSGKSWSTVTRSDESLISLTQISATDFYAMSDAGTLIKLKINP